MKIAGIETVPFQHELTRRIGNVNLSQGVRHGADVAKTDESDQTGTTIGALDAAAVATGESLNGVYEYVPHDTMMDVLDVGAGRDARSAAARRDACDHPLPGRRRRPCRESDGSPCSI